MEFYTHEQLDNFCKILESKSYNKFNSVPGHEKYNFMYQKCIIDDIGKRYFIDIRFYSIDYRNRWCSDTPKWICDAHLCLKTSDLARKGCEYGVAWVTFDCNSIESVEQFAEKMFKNLNGCYYERWNEY